MVKTQKTSKSNHTSEVEEDLFKKLDDMYVGPYAQDLYNELKNIIAKYDSDLVTNILPHIISVFELLNNKCDLVDNLYSKIVQLETENETLLTKLHKEKERCNFLLDESTSIESEAKLISIENTELKKEIKLVKVKNDALSAKTQYNSTDLMENGYLEPKVFINQGLQTNLFYCQKCLLFGQQMESLNSKLQGMTIKKIESTSEIEKMTRSYSDKCTACKNNGGADESGMYYDRGVQTEWASCCPDVGKESSVVALNYPKNIDCKNFIIDRKIKGLLFCDSMGRSLGEYCNQEDSHSHIDYMNNVYPGSKLEFIISRIFGSGEERGESDFDMLFVLG